MGQYQTTDVRGVAISVVMKGREGAEDDFFASYLPAVVGRAAKSL